MVQRYCDDPVYDTVLAGYVYIQNQQAKAEAELDAIGKMLSILQARSHRLVWLGTLMHLRLTRTNPNLAYKQIPIWLLTIVAALHPPVNQLALGYIRNPNPAEEDASSHLDDIRRIYESYRPLMHRTMPELIFPLQNTTKEEVLAGLDPALREKCVYCEAPVRVGEGWQPCGRCRLCLSRAAKPELPPVSF